MSPPLPQREEDEAEARDAAVSDPFLNFGTPIKFVFSEIRTEPPLSLGMLRSRRRRRQHTIHPVEMQNAAARSLCPQLSTPFRSQFARMSLPKPFSSAPSLISRL
jgi:hypothetical protein